MEENMVEYVTCHENRVENCESGAHQNLVRFLLHHPT